MSNEQQKDSGFVPICELASWPTRCLASSRAGAACRVERGHWDPLRSTVLLAYCESYADWHRLTEQVRGKEVVLQGGTRTVNAQGHVTTEGGKAAPNPLLPVIDRPFRRRVWRHVGHGEGQDLGVRGRRSAGGPVRQDGQRGRDPTGAGLEDLGGCFQGRLMASPIRGARLFHEPQLRRRDTRRRRREQQRALHRPVVQVRPGVLDFMQLAQTVFSKIVHDQLVASPGRVRAELPVELRPGR